MALLVGSESINIIALRHDRIAYIRRTDARIRALREVIEKVQAGEWKADGPEVKRAFKIGQEGPDGEINWQEGIYSYLYLHEAGNVNEQKR